MVIRHILSPIDFSEFSRHALDHAVAIARRDNATITVLNVYALVGSPAYAPGTPILPVTVPTPDDLDALLASMKRFVATEVGSALPMRFEISGGDAASEILERARAIPSDLIVMGTHGRAGFERLVLGSVTERVIHKAACPVLTVPPPMTDVAPVPNRLFSRMLCAIDFSDTSLRALEYALSMVAGKDTQLTLVHVVEVSPTPQSEAAGDRESEALGAYVAAAAQARAEQLERMVPDGMRASCRIERTVAIGKAHTEILRVAGERDSDVIVLGAHGFGLTQLMFGSTAHQVVRQARCPVLTVR